MEEKKKESTIKRVNKRSDDDEDTEEIDINVKAFLQKPSDITTASKAFEYILYKIGDYHFYQWKLMIIAGFCGLFTSLHNMGAGKRGLPFLVTLYSKPPINRTICGKGGTVNGKVRLKR